MAFAHFRSSLTEIKPKPEERTGEALLAEADFRTLFRYKKSHRSRIYKLREWDGGTELWVVSEENGKTKRARRIVNFRNPDDIEPFMEDVERELRAGGWIVV
jgi:hypothetical protein